MSELRIEVLFESWLIWDGNYPSWKKNDELFLKNINPATYEFSGKCIYVYHDDKKDLEFVVFDTGLLKFYLFRPAYDEFKVGEYYYGKITLLVDYFMWKESYQELPDVPDIFYEFHIESILKTYISDEHILEEDDIGIQPTKLSGDKYKNTISYEVDKIEINQNMGEFFLLNLKSEL
jgi:hypothetical protein